MAGEDRTTGHALEFLEALEKEPYRFNFFQALRRLESLAPSKPKLGRSARPVDDPVRLTQNPSLAFAPASLVSFVPARADKPANLCVSFLGLLGPNGPLPLHLTEYARDRLRNSSDPTFVRFLDVFHHRMLSLFYRMWADAQPAVSFDRPETDRFSMYVGSFFGMGLPSMRDRDAVPDLAKLHHAGQLVSAARSREGMKSILSGFFRLPTEIEPFVGQWLGLPDGTICRLGRSPSTGTLGRSIILGSRAWECQQKFRIQMGPLAMDDYQGLLPGSRSLDRLVALVRNYIGVELAWDVNLILLKEEVPPLMLNGKERLGWTTWLAARRMKEDVNDLCIDPEALMAGGPGHDHTRSRESEVEG